MLIMMSVLGRLVSGPRPMTVASFVASAFMAEDLVTFRLRTEEDHLPLVGQRTRDQPRTSRPGQVRGWGCRISISMTVPDCSASFHEDRANPPRVQSAWRESQRTQCTRRQGDSTVPNRRRFPLQTDFPLYDRWLPWSPMGPLK